jgi:hypothetical protein
MRTKTLAISLLAVAMLATACGGLNGDGDAGGGGGNGGGDTGIDHPSGADQLVLRVETGGGFVPVEYNLRALPGVSIYGDGRMIVEGPVIEIYPGPALPNLQVSQLTEEAVQAILREASLAGLVGEDAIYDYPCVTDLPTTTFTIVTEGRTHTVSAYALGFESEMGDPAACGDFEVDVDARAKLVEFQRKLGDLRSWLPEGSVGPEEEFAPSRLRVYTRPYVDDPELPQPETEWPLEGALGSFGEKDPNLGDTRCGVVAGADLDALLPLARSANQLTPWVSDGETFGLVFRPLLPDETDCA